MSLKVQKGDIPVAAKYIEAVLLAEGCRVVGYCTLSVVALPTDGAEHAVVIGYPIPNGVFIPVFGLHPEEAKVLAQELNRTANDGYVPPSEELIAAAPAEIQEAIVTLAALNAADPADTSNV